MREKDLIKIWKECMKLDIINRKAQLQDRKIRYVMEEIFGDDIEQKITTTTEWEDGIFDKYSNAEGDNYEEFKRKFYIAIKEADLDAILGSNEQ